MPSAFCSIVGPVYDPENNACIAPPPPLSGQSREGGPGRGEEECGSEERSRGEKLPKAARCPGILHSFWVRLRVPGGGTAAAVWKVVPWKRLQGVTWYI